MPEFSHIEFPRIVGTIREHFKLVEVVHSTTIYRKVKTGLLIHVVEITLENGWEGLNPPANME